LNDDINKSNIISFFKNVIDDKIQKDAIGDLKYTKEFLSLGVPNFRTASLIDEQLHKVSDAEFKKAGLDVAALDFSVLDFDITLTADNVRHIYRKHGKYGTSDSTMSNDSAYILIQDVLQSPDSIVVSRTTRTINSETEEYILDLDYSSPSSYSNGRFSIKLELNKIIDGYCFVLIMVVHVSMKVVHEPMKNKQLKIITAYKKKIK